MNALDWLQVVGSAVMGIVGLVVSAVGRAPGAIRVAGVGVVLLAVGFVVGGIEGDTSGLDWLEASAGAVGLVITGFALLVAATSSGRRR
jgi:hypothetical protein